MPAGGKTPLVGHLRDKQESGRLPFFWLASAPTHSTSPILTIMATPLPASQTVLRSPDLVPLIAAQADLPTVGQRPPSSFSLGLTLLDRSEQLLIMQATCTLWRKAALPLNKKRLFDLLHCYFDHPK